MAENKPHEEVIKMRSAARFGLVFSLIIFGVPSTHLIGLGIYYGVRQQLTSDWTPSRATTSDGGHTYQYWAEGVQYTSSRIIYADESNLDSTDIDDIIARSFGESTFPAYYNPRQPEQAVRHRGFHPASWKMMYSGLFFMLVWILWAVGFWTISKIAISASTRRAMQR